MKQPLFQHPDLRIDSYQMTCIALLLLFATVLTWRHQDRELQDQLRIESRRRWQLERELAKRDRQMDGALDEINRLKADDEPAG